MRKVYHFLTALLCLGTFGASAQAPCESITATNGNSVLLPNGITVTVSGTSTNTSTFTCPGPTPPPASVGPYQIGRSVSNYYEYTFAPGVTHVRSELVRLHDDDTIQFQINTANYPLKPGDVTVAPVANCASGVGTFVITTDGRLTSSGNKSGVGMAVFVNIQAPAFGSITQFKAEHTSRSINPLASDVIYSLCAVDDSCSLAFEAEVDSPACSGRDLQFKATLFPNTMYAWSTNAALTPTWGPSNGVHDPKVLKANQGHSGQYYVAAVRGSCVYLDTVSVLINQSPILGPVTQAGPKCPGEDDTIRLKQIFLPAGGWAIGYGINGRDTFDINTYEHVITAIQPEDANYVYNIYAADLVGCFSDTIKFSPKVRPAVTAKFEFDPREGCIQDTVFFKNESTSDSNLTIYSQWDWDDKTPLSSIDSVRDSVIHYYKIPKPNWKDTTYYVKLFVSNGRCVDTLERPVYFNHPIRAYYEIVDDVFDMCQGKLVEFDADDSTYVKPGTLPIFKWDFKDGDSAFTLQTSHTFNLAGEFYPTLIVEDILGCKDSFSLKLTVDSAGFVDFHTDKDKVCMGEEIRFIGDYSTSGYVTAIWNFSDGVIVNDSTQVNHSYREPGTYKVTFDVDYRICPDVHFEGEYTVKPVPSVYIGEDTSLCQYGDELRLKDQYNVGNPQGIKYEWSTPTKDKTSEVVIRHHGTYALTADLDGCKSSDTVVIRKNCYIDIPNVFTPNGDGQGDYFLPRQILSRNLTEFKMTIYNRWGKKVFETESNNGRGWDGKLNGDDQPVGVYVYFIEAAFGNGIAERYQGNVTLLR